MVAHGWNIDIGLTRNRVDLSTTPLGGSGTGRSGRCRACTLLGPEGPGHRSRERGLVNGFFGPHDSGRLVRGVGYRPYFENYTVDASILDTRLFLPLLGVGMGVCH